MSFIEDDIADLLKNDMGISAIVGSKVYPMRLPQDTQLPSVCFIAEEKLYGSTLTNPTPICKSQWLLNCSGTDRTELLTLAEAVRSCLNSAASGQGWDYCLVDKSTQGFEASGKDGGFLIYHVVYYVTLHYRES